jgi:serine/threonine protein kinase
MAPDVPVRPDPALPPIPPFPGGAAPETRTAFRPGDRLGQLDIVEKIGEGLHGEVFLAAHRHTGELSAIKAMHLVDAQDAKLVQRHLRTAAAAHRIRCANVVTVRDLGCEDNGVVWVQMELLEGHSVAELLARQGGRMSVPLAFHIGCGSPLCGLQAAGA